MRTALNRLRDPKPFRFFVGDVDLRSTSMSNYVYDSLVLTLFPVVRFHVFESMLSWPLFSLGRVGFSSFDIGPMLGRYSPDELSTSPDVEPFGADDGSFRADD